MNKISISLNFEVDNANVDDFEYWSQAFEEAALFAGAEDVEVTYSMEEQILSVVICSENDPVLLVEAGMILGAVQSESERNKERPQVFVSNWIALEEDERELSE